MVKETDYLTYMKASDITIDMWIIIGLSLVAVIKMIIKCLKSAFKKLTKKKEC